MGRQMLEEAIADLMQECNLVRVRYRDRAPTNVKDLSDMTSLEVIAEVAAHVEVVDEVQAQVHAQGVQATPQQRAQVRAQLQSQVDTRRQT